MFKQNIAPKSRKSGSKFVAPTKEQATTGRFMGAGDSYGIGYKTPEGKAHATPISDGPIPQKAFCFNPDNIAFKD